jgi:DNA-binding MarR family transcriptional regulator
MEATASRAVRETTATEKDLVAGWHELAERHARVTGALERALQTEHGLGVTEFEVLERLTAAADDKDQRRMLELAEAVHLSQSALSRLIGRLETEGLVSRSICPEDRRGIYTCVTDAGRARYDAARPTQRRVLAELLD